MFKLNLVATSHLSEYWGEFGIFFKKPEFALAFCTLPAQTGWPDDPLKLHFCRGLSPELQNELAC